MIYVTFSTIICIVGYQCPYIVIQFGFLFSWMWLRFYKKNTVDTIGGGYSYGDRSETFAVIYWFPPFLQCVASLPPGLRADADPNASQHAHRCPGQLFIHLREPVSPHSQLILGCGVERVRAGRDARRGRAEEVRSSLILFLFAPALKKNPQPCRQMALKALDQRVANSTSPASGGTPSKPAKADVPPVEAVEEGDIGAAR
jgi:hypothetical protein